MAGKAPSRGRRERGHTSRPYDRPNQSLLGSIASTVKGLFTPSSWRFSIPSWARAEEEEEEDDDNPSSFVAVTTEPDLTENEDEAEEAVPVRPRLPNRSKRQKLEDNSVPVSSTPIAPAYWLEPSTSRDNLAEKVEMPEPSIIGDCQIGRKGTPVVNGDDQSENSDGSASTSGCSSLISSQDKPHHRSGGLKLSESALEHLRGELKNKPAFQRPKKDASIATDSLLNNPSGNMSMNELSLWSCENQGIGRMPQRSTLIARTRPSFSMSSFGPPPKNSPMNKIASPFYEGSTTYGGASSYRKRQLPAASPYQFAPKIMKGEVKVKEGSFGGEEECMSAAARRILHTLKKMSTPVTDAKRIPNVGASPLDIPLALTPPSQRLKSYLSVPGKSPISSPKPPPIVNLHSISKDTLLKNHRTRLSKKTATPIPLRVQPIIPVLLQDTQETTSVSSPVPSNPPSSPGSSGGKMKTVRRHQLHTPAKAKETEENVRDEYELPNIPLPVKSMPVISFDLQPRQSIKSFQDQTDSNNDNELSFTFSDPIEYPAPAEILEPEKSLSGTFKFSSPLVATSKASSEISASQAKKPNASSSLITNGSVEVALRHMREAAARNSRQDDDISVIPSSNASTEVKTGGSLERKLSEKEPATFTASGFGEKFKPKAGSWSCSVCCVQNEENSKTCIACETPKSVPQEKSSSTSFTPPTSGYFANSLQSSDFFTKFQAKPGAWECPVCMVRNKEEDAKCVACETPNPSGAKKSSTNDTMSKHKTDENRKEMLSKNSSSSGSGQIFQNISDTWECDACLVRNALDKSKCIACETLRPSKDGNSKGTENLSFKSTPQQPTTGFKFSAFVSSPAAAPTMSSFKFGIPADQQKPSSSLPLQNIFGASASTTAAIPANVSFKFGVPSESPKSVEATTLAESTNCGSLDNVKSNVSNSTAISSVFKFGGQSGESSLVPKTTDAPSKVFTFGSGSQVETSSNSKTTEPSEISKTIREENTDCVEIPSTSAGTLVTTTTAVASSAPEPLKSDMFKFGSGATATTTTSSSVPGGFKFQPPASATFGTSPFGSGIKLGGQQMEPQKVPSVTALEGFKPSPIVPVSAAPTTTGSSASSPFHSKPSLAVDSQKTVQTVASGLSKPAQLNFGISGSTEVNRTSTTNSFGLFGTQQPFAFKAGDTSSALKNVNTVFGAPQASQAGNPLTSQSSSFTFGASSDISTQPSGGLKTEMKASVPNQGFSIGTPLQTAASSATPTSSVGQPLFAFGNTSASISPVCTSAFGVAITTVSSSSAAVNAPISSDTKAPSLFKFGEASSTDVKTFNPGFNFKRTNEDKTGGFAPGNKITFGSSVPFKSEATSGSGISTLPSAPSFQFGSSAPASSAGGFVFGSTAKTDASPAPAPQFSFGSGPTKPSTFGGFQPSQAAVTAASVPAFQFGGSVNTAATTTTMFASPSGSNVFTFGAKNNQLSLTPSGTTNVAPLFGASVQQPQQQQQQQQPIFGSNTVNAPAFGSISSSFGSVAPTKPEASSGGFSFGGSAPTQQQQQQHLFVFGASAEKKPAGTPQGTTGFNFSMPTAQVEGASSFRPQGFSLSTPPSFNFSATSTPNTNQPFQFQGANNSESGSTPASASVQQPRRMRKAIRRNPRNRPD